MSLNFKNRVKAILFLFLFTYPAFSPGQSNNNFNEFKDLFEIKTHKHNWTSHLKESENELSFIFSLLFVVYKKVFSSQDVDSCVFTPSCSVYAIENIKQKGLIIGSMGAFDRISRCNPGKKKNFQTDKETGKYYDPVK